MSVIQTMAMNKKSSVKGGSFGRFILVFGVLVILIIWSLSLIRTDSRSNYSTESIDNVDDNDDDEHSVSLHKRRKIGFPEQNELSRSLDERNQFIPRNVNRFPSLPDDHVVIVLYVHNRPQYLKVVVESLSNVDGINETLLVVSHDGYFEEMNRIVEGIRFCRVKQIFAPFSPHLFSDSFPGVSPSDCKLKENAREKKCVGNPDQYGNHRAPKIVSLKHHWWWMMNTVWDGLKETKGHLGHILFIEEDHFIFPNAYRNLELLIKMKTEKCPSCYAVNLAPSDVKSRGEGVEVKKLLAERMGNVGYSFNRTIWEKIHDKAQKFCYFDDYNWDITMWSQVYPSFGSPVYTLRGPRSSAIHFGKCGLHQGQGEKDVCIDNGSVNIAVDSIDKVANIDMEWDVHVYDHQPGYKAGFEGWGGWGDDRDRQLCMKFASMYHS